MWPPLIPLPRIPRLRMPPRRSWMYPRELMGEDDRDEDEEREEDEEDEDDRDRDGDEDEDEDEDDEEEEERVCLRRLCLWRLWLRLWWVLWWWVCSTCMASSLLVLVLVGLLDSGDLVVLVVGSSSSKGFSSYFVVSSLLSWDFSPSPYLGDVDSIGISEGISGDVD